MRAVLYTRVSRDDAREGRSVGEQEVECREVCAAQGWTVVAAHVDNDRSAGRHARKGRPGHDDLVALLAAGGADVLVLWEVERGDRLLSRWAALLDMLYDRGILVHVVSDERTFDPRRPNDMHDLQAQGARSERESAKTRGRILRNVRANATAGRPHGRKLYGYGREYRPGPKGPVLVGQPQVPEQAAVVREMARRVLAGESCYAIAKDLNAQGVATASSEALWTGERIKRLMVNPAYAGLRVLNGVVVGEAMWEGILTRDEHARLVARLTDPARRTVRDPSVRHMLTGAARCGVCESRMRVQKMRGYFAYVCAGRPPGSNLGGRAGTMHTAIKLDWLEGYVRDVVLTRLSRKDARHLFRRTDSGERAAAAAAEVKNLQKQLDETAAEVIAKRMSAGLAAQIEAGIAPLLEAARDRARPAADAPPALAALTAPGVDVEAVWDSLAASQRRELITAMMIVRVKPVETRENPRKFNPDRVSVEWIV
ncbi:MAG: recombinase family protein [Chloroflexota bacterium]